MAKNQLALAKKTILPPPMPSSRQVKRRELFRGALLAVPRRAETELFVGKTLEDGVQVCLPTLPIERKVRREMAKVIAKKEWREQHATV